MKSASEDRVAVRNCPACGAESPELLNGFSELPAILFPIEAEHRFSVGKAPLKLGVCDVCRHVFQRDIALPFVQGLYEDFYYLYPFKNLETMNRPYRAPFEALFNSMQTAPAGRLLEIGCESVDQMRFFLDRGFKCTAVNPTLDEAEVAKGEIEFIKAFYGDKPIPGKFDVIVSRFNLEHVIFLDQFMSMVRENLAPSGKVIVQVPNAENFLSQGILNILAHEHAHYFCKLSLTNLIARHGFNVEILPNGSDPSLICAFSDGLASYAPKSNFELQKRNIAELGSFIASSSGRVFLYGAGLSVTALLYGDDFDKGLIGKIRLIDDNTSLHGKYMPQSELQISNPSEIAFDSDDKIVLALAKQYHHQVVERLRASGCSAEIFAIDAEGVSRVA